MKRIALMMFLAILFAGCGQVIQETPDQPQAVDPPIQVEEPPTREEVLLDM